MRERRSRRKTGKRKTQESRKKNEERTRGRKNGDKEEEMDNRH